MQTEMKRLIHLAVVMLVIAGLLSTTEAMDSPFKQFYDAFNGSFMLIFLAAILMNMLVLLFIMNLSKYEIGAILGVGIALSIGLFLIVPIADSSNRYLWNLLSVPVFGIGVAGITFAIVYILRGDGGKRAKAQQAFGAFILLTLLGFASVSYLSLTVGLHPLTYDAVAYRFDATLGLQASAVLAQLIRLVPGSPDVIKFAYAILPFFCVIFYAAQQRNLKPNKTDYLVVWLISTAIAYVTYHLCPVAGPIYFLGSDFPNAIPAVADIPQGLSLVQPAPRNGVPSMHLGWALAMWLTARLMDSRILRWFSMAVLAITILATLALGEHYLVDLVIAVPFVMAVQAACIREIQQHNPARWRVVGVGTLLFVAWIIILRFGVNLFEAIPGLTWLAFGATLAVMIRVYRPLEQAVLASDHKEMVVKIDSGSTPVSRTSQELVYVAIMFVLSGCVGLIYEVLFSKSLALTFGSTSMAAYTVLATYMGGMAIGYWIGGRMPTDKGNALRYYAFCELGIGLYCLATPVIFDLVRLIYVIAASGIAPEAPQLTLFRMLLGGFALLPPTILMGMTLPILARFFKEREESLGQSVAALYGANTLGAAMGALMAGYWIIPSLGIFRTTLVAALVNILVAAVALYLSQQLKPLEKTPPTASMQGLIASFGVRTDNKRLGLFALTLLAIGGFITLALEVLYIHLLAVVAGNSTYAFSLMLFTFLIGLGLGAAGIGYVMRWYRDPPTLLAWLEIGLAVSVLLGIFQWSELPDYFASFADYPLAKSFGAREVVRGAVCFVAMLPPALFTGAIYPVAMECIGQAYPGTQVQKLGLAAAVNTLGNIAGVLIAGFILLPRLGTMQSLQLLAALSLFLSVMAIFMFSQAPRLFRWVPVFLVLPVFALQPDSFDYDKLSSGANVYFMPQGFGRVVDRAESADGGLTSVTLRDPQQDGVTVLTLLTNGKFQGNNALGGEMMAQAGFALTPLLHTSSRERALVIGLGTGVSARTLHDAGFTSLDIVDLSADIVHMATKHFGRVNLGVTQKKGVATHITDGRNFLMLQPDKYDVISMEVSSIWFAGAASLYNQEFYRLAKQRLVDRGVLQQWIQLHHITPVDIMYILGSVRAEFRYIWLYVIGGQGMIIASNTPDAAPSVANTQLLEQTESLDELLKLFEKRTESLLDALVLSPDTTDAFLGSFKVSPSFWISTDDNLFLEYSTPKGNVLDSVASYTRNLEFIKNKR